MRLNQSYVYTIATTLIHLYLHQYDQITNVSYLDILGNVLAYKSVVATNK